MWKETQLSHRLPIPLQIWSNKYYLSTPGLIPLSDEFHNIWTTAYEKVMQQFKSFQNNQFWSYLNPSVMRSGTKFRLMRWYCWLNLKCFFLIWAYPNKTYMIQVHSVYVSNQQKPWITIQDSMSDCMLHQSRCWQVWSIWNLIETFF